MGRWTVDYHDDVLRDKLKSLVSAAVQRAKLEKGEPTITYEAFVEELDEGDAFTSAMIDVLVKEMAERRTRPNAIDRRLFISERTAKSLSLQASSRVYQNRSHRRFNFLDYAPSPPSETEPSEPEDFGQPRGDSAPEGVRLNTDLYDAYSSMRFAADETSTRIDQVGDTTRLLAEIPTSEQIDNLPTIEQLEREHPLRLHPSSPPLSGFRNSFWSHPTSGGSLHRSDSLRRPNRTRNDSFSDFTLRRRLATRQNSMQEIENVRQDGIYDGTWDSGSSRFRIEDETASSSSAPLPHAQARRFFPLSAWTTARRRNPPADIWGPEPRARNPLASGASSTPTPAASQEAAAGSSTTLPQSSSELWYSLTSGRISPGASSTAEARRHSTGGDITIERRQLAPRLRRGGLRAPESLLSRYASPSLESTVTSSTSTAGPSAAQELENDARGSTERMAIETSLSLTTGRGGDVSWDGAEEHQLLTPRSVSPPDER